MDNKIVITLDGACDLPDELLEKYNLSTLPLSVSINGKTSYADIEITKEDIYNEYFNNGTIAKTSAISVGEYLEFFKTFLDKGYEVVHICMSSKISCCYQNCMVAQEELGDKLHVVESRSLSSGIGMLGIKGYELAEQGLSANLIADKLRELQKKIRLSFIIDNLKFLSDGGRCSKVTAMGANLLKIKPTVVMEDGKLETGNKYRGSFENVVFKFVEDAINNKNIDSQRMFITHSDIDKELLDKLKKEIQSRTNVKEIIITQAKAIIYCHCGPNTVGLVFMEK